MTSAEICLALVRATLATAAAACLAALLLAWLKVRSPRVHRAAWALVVVQGWLLVPWTLQIETPTLAAAAKKSVGGVSDADDALLWVAESASETPSTVDVRLAAPVDYASPVVLAWLVGVAMIPLIAAWRYARIVCTLPLGAAPDDPAWQVEWRRELAAARRGAMPSSAWACSVELRMTDRLGPLVAFVPFMYLVLAPRQLWAALTGCERRSILRHELAHLRRGDLWKSLAIRVLVLPQWFNPFVWLAVRRFDEAAEWACDELAAHHHDPLTLANSLLRTAELCAEATLPPRAAGFIPAVPRGRSKLSRRIHLLVNPRFKEESTMRKLAVPALLAALAAVQLIRIERVAAGDPATPPLPAADEVTRFTEGGAITLSAAADAQQRLQEFEEIADRPYVIEPPDVLSVQFNATVDASNLVDGKPKTKALFLAKPKEVLVNPDGKIALGQISVYVAGHTVDEARDAIAQELDERFDDVQVTVNVVGFNSKVCYVIDQRGKFGDVVRMPVPFPLTVDFNVGAALAQTDARDFDLADARIKIARPARNGVGVELVLPVTWDPAADAPTPDTNHPLLPGDRVFVEAPGSAPSLPVASEREVAPPPQPYSAEGSLPEGLPRIPPQRPVTIAKDPGPDAAVTLVLKLPDDRVSEQVIALTGPTTLGDLLAHAVYSEPIDFSAAIISLTRPFGPPEVGGEMEVLVGWDRTTQRPTADSDYGLESGDSVTINLVRLPKGAKVFAAPTLPKAKSTKPKPTAAAEADPAPPLEFQMQFVEDATGALADFEFPGRGGGMTVGDARAVLSALRVFKKHKLTTTMFYPVIRTEVGRPASFNLAEQMEAEGDGADFRVVRAVTVLARMQNDGGGKDSLLVEVRARAGDSEIDTGVAMEVGQTAIIQIPPVDGADDLPAHYIVVTPRWVE